MMFWGSLCLKIPSGTGNGSSNIILMVLTPLSSCLEVCRKAWCKCLTQVFLVLMEHSIPRYASWRVKFTIVTKLFLYRIEVHVFVYQQLAPFWHMMHDCILFLFFTCVTTQNFKSSKDIEVQKYGYGPLCRKLHIGSHQHGSLGWVEVLALVWGFLGHLPWWYFFWGTPHKVHIW